MPFTCHLALSDARSSCSCICSWCLASNSWLRTAVKKKKSSTLPMPSLCRWSWLTFRRLGCCRCSGGARPDVVLKPREVARKTHGSGLHLTLAHWISPSNLTWMRIRSTYFEISINKLKFIRLGCHANKYQSPASTKCILPNSLAPPCDWQEGTPKLKLSTPKK